MGYKSFVRSAVAASNRAKREANRQYKAVERVQDRLQKKMSKIEEKKEKIIDALQDEYAKGKFTKEQYEKLLARKEDVPLDLLVFGGVPGMTVAKRYITGKIEKSEFSRISEEVIPHEVQQERKRMVEGFISFLKQLEQFVDECPQKEDRCCWHCNKRGFFHFVRNMETLSLCRRCRSLLKTVIEFKGFFGDYYEMPPLTIALTEVKSTRPTLLIRNRCLLSL